MFFPRIVKEFDEDGSCTTKIGGVIGKNAQNCSIISISASEAFSDIIACWTADNLHTYPKGIVVPDTLFRPTVDSTDDKPWTPSLHPVALFRVPTVIIKLRGHSIQTGPISKPSVRSSLLNYCRPAVDWLDVLSSHRVNFKNLSYSSFDSKYYPPGFNKKATKEKSCGLQPTFELEPDSQVYLSVNKDIDIIKTKHIDENNCDMTMPPTPMVSTDNPFETPNKAFLTPKTPKPHSGADDATVSSEAVKEKARYTVLFYRLLLSSKYTDPNTDQAELILGNLSDNFLTALNISTRSESIRVFNNAFTTYRKDRLDSENFLDTAINFPHLNRAMISLLLLGEYRSSPLDEDTEYLTQAVSILSFLPPPKKGENLDYVSYVQKSKETKMEDAIEERAEKCTAYDKKLFIKGRQNTHHDAISCLANLVVFLEFILDDEGTSDTPTIITMFRSIGRILISPTFRNFAEKNETAIPWLTHTLICQFQSLLNRFVEVSNNFTYQRKVENEANMPASLLDATFKTYERFMNNLDDALNNASNLLFGVKPLSFIEQSAPSKRKQQQSGSFSDSKKQNTNGVARGWLVCTGGSFSFPKALVKLPCRNFALEGSECGFGRSCKYDHKVFPRGYRKPDQAVICEWVNKTDNVRFADSIQERDRNIKFSPFGSSSTSAPSSGTATTPVNPPPAATTPAPSQGTSDATASTPAASQQNN